MNKRYVTVGTVLLDMHCRSIKSDSVAQELNERYGLMVVSDVRFSLHNEEANWRFVENAVKEGLKKHQSDRYFAYSNKMLVVFDNSNGDGHVVAAYSYDGRFVAIVELAYINEEWQ